MHFKRYILFITLVFCFLLSAFSSFAQQLKLGNNPTSINKSAVLQLDSKNQGLLLTRISDTANIQSPPDGMIIYFTDTTGKTSPGKNDGVYVRKNGYWYRQSKGFKVEDKSTIDFYFDETNIIVFHLPDASGGISGLMGSSSIQQTFGGDKIFQDSLISDSVVYSNNLIIDNAKNNGDTAFLTTDSDGKIMLANMDEGYWKVGGNYITDDSKAKIGKKYPADLSISTNNIERIRITADGETGIATTTPSDTLDVSGSFKLGADGSSFERMVGEDTSKIRGYLKQINVLDLLVLGDKAGPYIFTLNVPGVKKDAWVVVNPANDWNNLSMKLTADIPLPLVPDLDLPLGQAKIRIAWARAPDNNSVEVCLMFDFNGVVNLSSLMYIVNLLGKNVLLGLLHYSSTPIGLNILYCNPK